jgi:hypothetical protein
MSEILYTKKRDYQYNGQVNSSDYNARIEENYQDLVYLYNKANMLDVKLTNIFERVLKDHQFLSMAIADLEDRVIALESAENALSIHSFNQFDYASFVGSSFAVGASELLSFDPVYNIITLPKVSSSSFSKLKFFNQASGQVVPDFFKAKIDTSFSGADTSGAVVDMTPIYNAILDSPEKIWKRNVIADTVAPAGAQMMLYVKIPTESAGSLKTNMIKLNPYPMFGCDITTIEYTTKTNPTLTNADVWYPLNRRGLYDGTTEAIGKVAPGGWSVVQSDAARNSGPMAFVFADLDITAIRIKFVQRNYFIEGGKYIYSYGLSDLDIRYDKYLPTGRTIIKYTPPSGLISEITNVTPKIFNVPMSLLSSAFSYRILYDDGSGNYSEENPGASASVWIEVTLNMLDDNTVPVLSDLIIDYI